MNFPLKRSEARPLPPFLPPSTLTHFITVIFPVKGPKLISPKGGWKPSRASASSCVRTGRLAEEERGTVKVKKELL